MSRAEQDVAQIIENARRLEREAQTREQQSKDAHLDVDELYIRAIEQKI